MYSPHFKLDADLLSVFIAVAEIGRISEAAKQLHLSQPAVTAQMRRLEESLHIPLFLRSVRGVTLTAAGQKLLVYARQMRGLIDEATETISLKEASVTGTLSMAASTTVAGHVLPHVLTSFRKLYPRVAIRVEVSNTDKVLDLVRSGSVPLGLVEGHRRAARLRLEPFVKDEIVPVIGTDITNRELLDQVDKLKELADVLSLPIIWREPGSGTRTVIEAALGKAGRPPLPAPDLVLGTTQAIRTAVLCGLGIAFLSRWCIQSELHTGRMRILQIPGLKIERAFHWALPAGGVGAVAELFLAHARRNPPSLTTP